VIARDLVIGAAPALKIELIHGAGAGAARVAARSARAAGGSRLVGLFSAHGKAGKLLAKPLTLTLGAGGFLRTQNNGFKLVTALLADVFKNRHIEWLS
jgi:hypothetical protein